MSWLASIAVGLLTGGLALVCAGVVANACVGWYRVSSFEGASGYLVVGVALLGGIAGLVLGIVTSRLVAASAAPGFLKSLGWSCGIVALIAGIAAGLAWLLADIPPEVDGRELALDVEVRLPAGETVPPAAGAGDSYVALGAASGGTLRKTQRGELSVAAARLEDGRWIVPGSVLVFTTRGRRILDVVIGGTTRAGFVVPLPRRPGRQFERWSDWLPHPRAGSPPWPASRPSYRFRVRPIEPPPPPASEEELAAQRFAALAPSSPLVEWLRFVGHDQSEERVAVAMAVVAERQGELAEAIGLGGTEGENALVAVTRLGAVSPQVAEAVLAEGRGLADSIRDFNGMSADDPDFYTVQVVLRSRFSYWHRAWWTVHRLTGADGRPPVQAILDLVRERAEGTTMDEIVVNARAHLDGLHDAASGAR